MNFPAPPISEAEMEKILGTEPMTELDKHWVHWFEHFFGLPKSSLTKELLSRFRKINTQETFMNVVPAIQKLLKPLEESCRAYCFGFFGASVAMSGVVAESLPILLWEMHGLTLSGKAITVKQEKTILGKNFDRMEQSRRIELLLVLGWITQDQKQRFHQIRDVRNRYLHSWQEKFDREEGEALLCYQNAFTLFRQITGVELQDGSSIKANPLLVKWMEKKL